MKRSKRVDAARSKAAPVAGTWTQTATDKIVPLAQTAAGKVVPLAQTAAAMAVPIAQNAAAKAGPLAQPAAAAAPQLRLVPEPEVDLDSVLERRRAVNG